MLLETNEVVQKTSTSWSPFMEAAVEGNLDVVAALLEAHADPNKFDATASYSALHFACLKPKNHPVIAALLAAGAKVSTPGAKHSPLSVAVSHNCLESMRMLIATGASLSAGKRQPPPLHVAAMTNRVDAAKILLEHNADINLRDKERGMKPIEYAIANGYDDFVKFCISVGADVSGLNSKGLSYLHVLSESSSKWKPEEIHTYVPHECDLYIRDTPRDFTAVFNTLIAAKADITADSRDKVTPMMSAAEQGNIGAVKALVGMGMSVEDVADDGSTALSIACVTGHLAVVSALIAEGADVNAIDNNGSSPLCLAIIGGHAEVCRALITAGADVNHIRKGATLLDLAHAHKLVDIQAILTEAGAVRWLELMVQKYKLVRVVAAKNLELFNKQIEDAEEEEKEVCLVASIRLRNHEAVKCLLAMGTNPRTQIRGADVLIYASGYGSVAIVRELIDAKARISAKDAYGETALDWAMRGKHKEVVALLQSRVDEEEEDVPAPLAEPEVVEAPVKAVTTVPVPVPVVDTDGDSTIPVVAQKNIHDEISMEWVKMMVFCILFVFLAIALDSYI
jgi:ankyrin repeat protein